MRILAEVNATISDKDRAMGKEITPGELHPGLVPESVRALGKPDSGHDPNEDARQALARQVNRAR